MDSSVTLNIADLNIALKTKTNHIPPRIRKAWAKFVTDQKPDWTLRFVQKKSLKEFDLDLTPSVWNENRFQIKQKYFYLDGDALKKEIFMAAAYRLGWGPPIRAAVSLLLMHLGGLILHGAAFLDREGGVRSFYGPSGRGKSTLSKLALEQGKVLLTDESTAILPKNGGYWAYSTPFYGELTHVTKNTGGPLLSAALINHGTENQIRHLPKKDFFYALLTNVFPFPDTRFSAEQLFANIEKITVHIEGYELFFVPKPNIWEYLDGYFKSSSQAQPRYSLAGH